MQSNNIAPEEFANREFPMTDKDFEIIREIAYQITGIKLSAHKRNMVYGRLARRVRKLQLDSFRTYCDLLRQPNSPEEKDFVNSITTNLTAFFRENHHFEYLKNTVVPSLKAKNRDTKKIRIWSAGCSTGEEPYSIAMVLKSFPELSSWDVKILATDLDSNVVNKGKSATYAAERAEKIPAIYTRFFKRSKDGEQVRIVDAAAELISFKQLNLLHEWPMKNSFDVIFCRNVIIYFDAETQKVLFDRYANLLTNDGHLFIGHSENLHNISNRFHSIGRTIYQRAQ